MSKERARRGLSLRASVVDGDVEECAVEACHTGIGVEDVETACRSGAWVLDQSVGERKPGGGKIRHLGSTEPMLRSTVPCYLGTLGHKVTRRQPAVTLVRHRCSIKFLVVACSWLMMCLCQYSLSFGQQLRLQPIRSVRMTIRYPRYERDFAASNHRLSHYESQQ